MAEKKRKKMMTYTNIHTHERKSFKAPYPRTRSDMKSFFSSWKTNRKSLSAVRFARLVVDSLVGDSFRARAFCQIEELLILSMIVKGQPLRVLPRSHLSRSIVCLTLLPSPSPAPAPPGLLQPCRPLVRAARAADVVRHGYQRRGAQHRNVSSSTGRGRRCDSSGSSNNGFGCGDRQQVYYRQYVF